MHCIALIQNESEMMRYSWADIRPMIERIEGYDFDGYTAENIEGLFPKLSSNHYDAIIIASNACNDSIVRDSLIQHKNELSLFFEKGGGLLVSFQMKMAEFDFYDFLPDEFKVSAINRIAHEEHPKDGDISIGEGQDNHTILRYPEKINIHRVKQRSLTNNLVEGIYWIYIHSQNPENYKTIIEDNSYSSPRPLLLASREDFDFRIVISAIPLDWQVHDDLWENAVRYVVEGRPSIAVIRKSGSSIFDFRYLLASLEISKVSYAEYIFDSMSLDGVDLGIHDTYLLSPSWSRIEVENFIESASDLVTEGRAEIFFFGDTKNGTPILQAVSNTREYQIISRNAITWLISKFPQKGNEGYWGGSFWTTVDVLNTLVDFDIPITQFKEKILNKIEKKDKSGSYDEVLGATCAMLEVYDIFLGRNHEKTQRTLRWIQNQTKKKTLFERSTAYEVLLKLNIEVPESELLAYKNEVMNSSQQLQNEFKLYRYGKTLLACGFITEASIIAAQLERLQNKLSGKWVNIPNTAAIVDFLIDLQAKSKNPSDTIDEMIFKGVQFIKYTYSPDEFSWKKDISATAKGLKALRSFEKKIKLPIDVVKNVVRSSDTRAKNFIAIETAAELNYKLLDQVNALKERARELQRTSESYENTIQNLSRISACSIMFIILSVIYLSLFIKFLLENKKFSDLFILIKDFSSQYLLIILIPIFAIGLCALLIYILKRLNKLPRWLESIVSAFFEVKND